MSCLTDASYITILASVAAFSLRNRLILAFAASTAAESAKILASWPFSSVVWLAVSVFNTDTSATVLSWSFRCAANLVLMSEIDAVLVCAISETSAMLAALSATLLDNVVKLEASRVLTSEIASAFVFTLTLTSVTFWVTDV